MAHIITKYWVPAGEAEASTAPAARRAAGGGPSQFTGPF